MSPGDRLAIAYAQIDRPDASSVFLLLKWGAPREVQSYAHEKRVSARLAGKSSEALSIHVVDDPSIPDKFIRGAYSSIGGLERLVNFLKQREASCRNLVSVI